MNSEDPASMPVPSDRDSSRAAASQQQFLNVISRDEATARFQQHLNLRPLGREDVPLQQAHGRVLAEDVVADVDVSGFDRSNVDGFAVRAEDTWGAMEESPRTVHLNPEVLAPGIAPEQAVAAGTATTIATGAMIPRGADAVVMVEDTDVLDDTDGSPQVQITRAVSPGQNLTFAGTDIALGETILRRGQLVTAREIGVLAAIGRTHVIVTRRPRVAIISTGNEIVAPGEPRPPGFVYDSNLAILTATVTELGGEPVPLGVVGDDEQRLTEFLNRGLECDLVVLSGGTSKGAGDLSYRVVQRLNDPGIVAHGVALKPGKPICLAVTAGKPVVILPGFPTSAIFTFHEFVAPVLRAMAGLPRETREVLTARLPHRVNSDRGRIEYALVNLVRGPDGLVAYPIGKGSGSVTTFSQADGFLTIDQHTEILEAGTTVKVHRLSRDLKPADLVVIGSHCVGLDLLLGEMQEAGYLTRAMHVGSTGGLAAARRGECDVAGIHLRDPATGQYNRHLIGEDLILVPGYRRMQCFVFRPDDERFRNCSVDEAISRGCSEADCRMVNRNAGSGTRVLIDELLGERRPAGYSLQTKSHNAVAAAISQRRGDWGIAIESVAAGYGLATIPIQDEQYDFVIPRSRVDSDAVRRFGELLDDPTVRQRLEQLGFRR